MDAYPPSWAAAPRVAFAVLELFGVTGAAGLWRRSWLVALPWVSRWMLSAGRLGAPIGLVQRQPIELRDFGFIVLAELIEDLRALRWRSLPLRIHGDPRELLAAVAARSCLAVGTAGHP